MSEPNRKRILLVTRNLPPLLGGMERLNWHMADELAKHADVRIIGPAGAAAAAPVGVVIDEVPLKPLRKFLLHAQRQAWRVARTWKPDVVLAGSGLTAPAAWFAARASGARAAAYVHGLDIAVRHPIYRGLWHPVLRRLDCVIANSRATAELARAIGVKPARIGIVHPGVELPAETGVADAVTRLRAELQLADRPVLLSVGRLSERKGLREFVSYSLPRIVASRPDAMLLVVGEVPSSALHAQAQTVASIREAAALAGVAGNVRFLGAIPDEELESAYRCADVHVFPVRQIPGDIEGFGMVAVEAAAHGLPTVAFGTGGVVDAVTEGESGYLIVLGDYQAFADAVVRMLTDTRAWGPTCIAVARRFAWSTFGRLVFEQLAGARLPIDIGCRHA